jgi:hypothetical protein
MTCINPNCKGQPVKRPEHSTWMFDVYYCPGTITLKCDLRFQVPTTVGKVCGFAPSIIALSAAVGLGLELDHSHGSDWLDSNWFDGGSSV